MGVRWGEDELVFWPFDATRTLRNLRVHGEAETVDLHRRRAPGRWKRRSACSALPTCPATAIDGSVIEDVLSWHEVVVTEITPSSGRTAPLGECAPGWSRPARVGEHHEVFAAPATPPSRHRSRLALARLGAERVSAELERLQGARRQDGRLTRARGDGLRAPLRRRADVTEIVVTAPARLHFGMLDPAGVGSRRFGGVGVGVESPRVVVAVQRPAWREGRRARTAGRSRCHVRRPGARGVRLPGGTFYVDVREAIPPHAGLASGDEARPGDRARSGRARGDLRLGRSSSRTPPGAESAPAWAPGPSPLRASWSRPACCARRLARP